MMEQRCQLARHNCTIPTNHHRIVPNFRELGMNVGLQPGLLYRSSNPWNCTKDDALWLLNHIGIKCIHDLRTPFEREQMYETESQGYLHRHIVHQQEQEQEQGKEQEEQEQERNSVQVLHVPLLNQSALQRYIFFQANWQTKLLILGIAVGVIPLESVRSRINPLISQGGLTRMYECM